MIECMVAGGISAQKRVGPLIDEHIILQNPGGQFCKMSRFLLTNSWKFPHQLVLFLGLTSWNLRDKLRRLVVQQQKIVLIQFSPTAVSRQFFSNGFSFAGLQILID
jgi:hypothetical protein